MANPQIENGHVKIANELIEQFAKLNLSAYEWRILMAILRKTYGWNKKTDRISLTQFQEITGIPSHHIAVNIKHLVEKNIITKHNGKLIMEYGLQKDYTMWVSKRKVVHNRVVPNDVLHNSVVHNQVVPINVVPTKDITTQSGSTEIGTRGSTEIGTASMPKGSTEIGTNKRQYKDNIKTEGNGSMKEIYDIYEKEIGQVVTPMIAMELVDIEKEYGLEIFKAACKKAKVKNLKYIQPILEQYKINGIPNEEKKLDPNKPTISTRYNYAN
jgi:phage replication O-like protein O